MHLFALVLIFAFAALTAVLAAAAGSEDRSRRALVLARVKRRGDRPDR